jgi:hypothetical protein
MVPRWLQPSRGEALVSERSAHAIGLPVSAARGRDHTSPREGWSVSFRRGDSRAFVTPLVVGTTALSVYSGLGSEF